MLFQRQLVNQYIAHYIIVVHLQSNQWGIWPSMSYDCQGISFHWPPNFLSKSIIKPKTKIPSKLGITGPFCGEKWLVDSPHKGPVMCTVFLYNDMECWYIKTMSMEDGSAYWFNNKIYENKNRKHMNYSPKPCQINWNVQCHWKVVTNTTQLTDWILSLRQFPRLALCNSCK